DSLLTELKRDQAIGRITLVSGPAIAVNHLSVRAIAATAVKGPMLLSAAQGRLPAADNEIALGASTMRRIGARIGPLAPVTAPPRARGAGEFRRVGPLPTAARRRHRPVWPGYTGAPADGQRGPAAHRNRAPHGSRNGPPTAGGDRILASHHHRPRRDHGRDPAG